MDSNTQTFWTVGGGKGGVGKSLLTASMGVVLARMGKSVVVVDADLGTANLHTYLGIKSPSYTLVDALNHRGPFGEVLLPTCVPGLRLISCAVDIPGIADPSSSQKEMMIRFISDLDADYILVDLGAGTSSTVLDFFNMSDQGIVVASPEPASLQNAYAFIKSAIYRKIELKFGSHETVAAALRQLRESIPTSKPRTMIDFYDSLSTHDPEVTEGVANLVDNYRPLIVVNMANSDQDQRVAEIIQLASKRFLNVDIRFCGLILCDPAVRRATQRMTLLDFDDMRSIAAQQIQQTVQRLLGCSGFEKAASYGSDRPAPVTPTMGLNDRLKFMGRELHIQTEDLGYMGRFITTQVFCDGRVVISTKSEYPAAVQGHNDPRQVVDLMRRQHFNVIRELESRKVRFLWPSA